MPTPNEEKGFKGFVTNFLKTPTMYELRGSVSPYKAMTKSIKPGDTKISVAVYVFTRNAELPSNQNLKFSYEDACRISDALTLNSIKNNHPHGFPLSVLTPGIYAAPYKFVYSLPPLTGGYSFADVFSLYVIPLFLNRLAIDLLTFAEFGLRTLGSLLNYPGHKASQWINENVDNVLIKNTLKAGIFLLTLPSQALTFAADALLYSKQLIDSAVHLVKLINPFWWMAKAVGKEMGKDSDVPSLEHTGRTFVKAVVNLLPAAAIVLTAVFTAGLSVPILNAIAPSFHAAGSAVVSTILAPAAIAAKAIVGAYIIGAIATVGKLFSATFEGVIKATTENKKSKDGPQSPKTDKSSSHESEQEARKKRFLEEKQSRERQNERRQNERSKTPSPAFSEVSKAASPTFAQVSEAASSVSAEPSAPNIPVENHSSTSLLARKLSLSLSHTDHEESRLSVSKSDEPSVSNEEGVMKSLTDSLLNDQDEDAHKERSSTSSFKT